MDGHLLRRHLIYCLTVKVVFFAHLSKLIYLETFYYYYYDFNEKKTPAENEKKEKKWAWKPKKKVSN